MLPCTSTEMDGVLMTASTPWWRKFDQDPKIRWPQPNKSFDLVVFECPFALKDGIKRLVSIDMPTAATVSSACVAAYLDAPGARSPFHRSSIYKARIMAPPEP